LLSIAYPLVSDQPNGGILTIWIPLPEYGKRKHIRINGKLVSKNMADRENEHRMKFILSNFFGYTFFDIDPSNEMQSKIDYIAFDENQNPCIIAESKTRHYSSNDNRLKKGWWIFEEKMNELLDACIGYKDNRHHPFADKNRFSRGELKALYVWGFKDGIWACNLQESKVWLCELQQNAGIREYNKFKRNGGKDAAYLVPKNHKGVQQIKLSKIPPLPWTRFEASNKNKYLKHPWQDYDKFLCEETKLNPFCHD
jgi:hypothetical protein